MKGSGIYKITCSLNNKIYVGSAINLYDRKFKHLRALRNNKHCNIYLQRAFNKYGEEIFIFEILELVPQLENESKLSFKKRLVYNREQVQQI